MRQGKSLITFVILLFATVLLCYLGYFLVDTVQEPFTTTYVYTYTLHDSIQTEGLILRKEEVLPQGRGILDVTRREGEKVGKGQTVGILYQNDQALAAQERQEALQMEMAQLGYAIDQEESVSSVARIDEEIIQGLSRLRGLVANQEFSSLDQQVMELKSGVLRREYTYGANLKMEDLTRRMEQLRQEYWSLSTSNQGAITYLYAPEPGVFSSFVDGYEGRLTQEQVELLTPAQLRSLMDENPSLQANTAGKLITSDHWYVAVAVSQEQGEELRRQGRVLLRFAGEVGRDVPMWVERVNQPQNGQVVVILGADRYLEQTTLLRHQAVELIFDSVTGLRVPKPALRVETTLQDLQETEPSQEPQTIGVYAVTGGKAEFKPVELVAEGKDFYVVRSAVENQKALRAGDEIVIYATELYHGKLLRY